MTHAHDSHGDHDSTQAASNATSPVSRIKKVSREPTVTEKIYLPAIAAGLGVTLRHFFKNVFGRKKYTSTIQYPDVKPEYAERFRGMHRLVPREDGQPRCVACFMCQTACPARCIHIEAGETSDKSIEKFPVVFKIDELRCVVCGLCVEACPCDAIRMDTGFHPPPVSTRKDGHPEKHDLLEIFGRKEKIENARATAKPPATAGGTGRVDRAHGDKGAGGVRGGYDHP